MNRYLVNIPENKVGDYDVAHDGDITVLRLNGNVIMADNELEYHTHQHFLPNAHGHILSAGLGLGMIHAPLIENEKFKSITIIEKSQEVIDLVWDHCPKDERFTIVHSDIYDYEPTQKFDIGWFDSWIGDPPGTHLGSENSPFYSETYERDMKERFEKHCEQLYFWRAHRRWKRIGRG